MKMLVVDDDFVSRSKLEALLSMYGQCDTAEDGDQAWKTFKDAQETCDHYNLITMDIDMPGMSGHEVVAKIRDWEKTNNAFMNGKEAKILMVTSMQSRTDVISSFREGCESYIKKPITPENLEESLKKLGVFKYTETKSS